MSYVCFLALSSNAKLNHYLCRLTYFPWDHHRHRGVWVSTVIMTEITESILKLVRQVSAGCDVKSGTLMLPFQICNIVCLQIFKNENCLFGFVVCLSVFNGISIIVH